MESALAVSEVKHKVKKQQVKAVLEEIETEEVLNNQTPTSAAKMPVELIQNLLLNLLKGYHLVQKNLRWISERTIAFKC
jgi:hypothetical protein